MSLAEPRPEPRIDPPAGYPRARVPSLARRVRQAIAAVKAVGETVAAVEISPEGAVRVLTAAAGATALNLEAANEWDDVLPR